MLLHDIWLAELEGMTLLQKHRLLERHQDPEALYHSDILKDKDLSKAEKILTLCQKKRIGILPLSDERYPARLRNTPDAPLVLYYAGTLPDWEERPFIGVVGTRKVSDYGLQVSHQMGFQIALCGGMVVSGGASGADTAAMRGAMEAGCPVVGVMGTGLDTVYPRENRDFFASVIRRGGCLLSEYAPASRSAPWHFRARNRIISGISNGTLVVEAPEKSGALVTARFALEQGRDVFVVPGNINTAACEGSNRLLQEGATPVFTGWDVVSGYAFLYPGKLQKDAKTPPLPRENGEKREMTRKKSIDNGENSAYSVVENNRPPLSEDEKAVLAQLTGSAQEPADLIAQLDMPSGKVLSALTMLTVKGLARKHPGGRYSLK